MFERYTEKARRVIFFGRYEASQFGSPYIETEHLLLGLLREDKALTNRFLRSHASVESIRRQVEGHTTIRESVSTSVDLPISDECKRVLAFAAEEAERLSHKHIGTEHLLLGILREEKSFAAELLRERGLQLNGIREQLATTANQSPGRMVTGSAPISESSRDLTQAATEGQLEPVFGRDLELDTVIEILGSCRKNNPLLMGSRGVGKRTIVEGLAQRMAEGKVPSFLAEKRILAVDPDAKLLSAQQNASETILFIADLQEGAGILKRLLLHGGLQCIATLQAREELSWFAQYFRIVHVRPLDEQETLSVLKARKGSLEKFHGVTYSEEALQFAAHSSGTYLKESPLPGKAVELLDAAGSLVKLCQAAPPLQIADAENRIRVVVSRLEKAIANHEFEKARFYSEEEHKEKLNLRLLQEKLHVGDLPCAVVGPDDLKQVVSRWSAYPYCP